MTQSEIELAYRAPLSIQAQDTDTMIVECFFGGKWCRFDISSLELQHLDGNTLWARYFEKACTELAVPPPVRADGVIQ